jgi:hypothetical protein
MDVNLLVVEALNLLVVVVETLQEVLHNKITNKK